MKSFFIKHGTRKRVMVRSNDGQAQDALEAFTTTLGFQRVGFVAFWWAVLTAKRPKAIVEVSETDDSASATP